VEIANNTTMGMVVCVAATVMGFALVWWIAWLVVLGALAIAATMVARSFRTDTVRIIPAAELERAHRDWLNLVAQTRAVTRDEEVSPHNRGRAAADVAP
jgi:cytochrome o ubiquinol oxidase subunit 1